MEKKLDRIIEWLDSPTMDKITKWILIFSVVYFVGRTLVSFIWNI
jgi:hypothetical protein